MHRNLPTVLVCVQKYEGNQKHGEQCRRPANYALSRVELSQSPRGGFEIHARLLIFFTISYFNFVPHPNGISHLRVRLV